MDLKIAFPGHDLQIDQAFLVCRWYDVTHPDTLTYYDFAGIDADPHAHDKVDLGHAARLVVVNARLDASDVGRMMRAAEHAPWDAVGHQESLESAVDPEALLGRAELLYVHFRSFGLGPTRTHKLLQLLRPQVIPVVDSVVRLVYADRAADAGQHRTDGRPAFWPPLAEDIRANAAGYQALRSEAGAGRLARLTSPRLHDILVWSLNGREQAAARAVL